MVNGSTKEKEKSVLMDNAAFEDTEMNEMKVDITELEEDDNFDEDEPEEVYNTCLSMSDALTSCCALALSFLVDTALSASANSCSTLFITLLV